MGNHEITHTIQSMEANNQLGSKSLPPVKVALRSFFQTYKNSFWWLEFGFPEITSFFPKYNFPFS